MAIPAGQGPAAGIPPEVDEAVRRIIRSKLRVTLDSSDGRQANQDALEVLSSVRLALLRKLRSGGAEAVQDLEDYASVTAYHACAEHLRGKYAGRFRLQYKLRYFLSHHRRFSVWCEDGEPVCGFAPWRTEERERAPGARVFTARYRPEEMGPQVRPPKNSADLSPGEWEEPLARLFDYLGGPVPLSALVAIIAPLAGVPTAEFDDLSEQRAPGPSPESQSFLAEILSLLWREILEMDLRWRRALLLNPPRDMELEVFERHGIAGVGEIGAAVALEDGHYRLLWNGLPLDDRQRRAAFALVEAGERFAFLWAWLPVADALIASVFGGQVQQVINLRRLAKDRLAERVAPRLARGNRVMSGAPLRPRTQDEMR